MAVRLRGPRERASSDASEYMHHDFRCDWIASASRSRPSLCLPTRPPALSSPVHARTCTRTSGESLASASRSRLTLHCIVYLSTARKHLVCLVCSSFCNNFKNISYSDSSCAIFLLNRFIIGPDIVNLCFLSYRSLPLCQISSQPFLHKRLIIVPYIVPAYT